MDLLFKYKFIIAKEKIIKKDIIKSKRQLPEIIPNSPFRVFCMKFVNPMSLIFLAAKPLATNGESEIMILKTSAGINLFHDIFVRPIAQQTKSKNPDINRAVIRK